ncbi:glycosyltransferase [Patescibacteria group bacterium]|nr:glycosyltransferase [Patescibacteria group bacterium]MBU1256057.1 glycosyltransferase [Patescibacteria group bacterium]
MTCPLISIVTVASPHRTRSLIRLINSVYQSTYKNFEIIVVDNSLNPHLASTIKTRFPKITFIIMPQNTGMLGFNIGYINAQGKYILSLDDDSGIRKHTLQKIVTCFQNQPSKTAVLSLTRFNPLTNSFYAEAQTNQRKAHILNFSTGACVFRKKAFKKIGYYDQDFFCWIHEDDFGLRTLNQNLSISFQKDIVVDHFEKPSATLRKNLIILSARNKVWLNLKHFSAKFIPLLIARDLIWILLLPLRRRSIKALFYGLSGYLSGWLNPFPALKKRQVVNPKLQKIFLKQYLLQ